MNGVCDRSSITLVGRRMTDVSSPDQLEYIQKTNFSNYVKGNFQTDMMRDALGFGIFAADGHNWSSSRKTMANIFTANSFAGIITDSIETSLVHLESILTKRSKSGVEFDLQALFFAFTLSSFVKLGYVNFGFDFIPSLTAFHIDLFAGSYRFGQDIGCLTSETDVQVPFAEAFDFAQWQMMNRFTNPLWKVTEAFSGDGRKMRHAVKTMNDFAYSIIDGREKTVAGEKPKDLLGLLMNIRFVFSFFFFRRLLHALTLRYVS
jgi:cytochrome P450